MKIKLLLISLIILSCNRDQKNIERNKEELIKADIAMSDMAQVSGFTTAIIHYADSDIVKFTDTRLPVIGLAALSASYNKDDDVRSISWKPVKAEASASGDLGYTWGYWKFVARDTTYHGVYFTAWKKQKDGSWKVALDGGNETPKPE